MSIPNSPNLYGPSGSSLVPLTNEDLAKFSRIFNNCNPKDGDLDGEAARDLLMRSKLPIDVLGQIWNLADTRNRGRLDQSEFIIAMYFVQHFMNGTIKAIPSHLPPELLSSAKGGQMGSPAVEGVGPRSRSGTFNGNTPNLGISRTGSTSLHSGYSSVRMPTTERVEANPRSISLNNSPFIPKNAPEEDWAIKPEDKAKFDRFFTTIDINQKGYITGEEAVQYFLRSKLPEAVLAQIWDLADINQSGQLNREEFAVSMYLIQLKLSGGELPQVLPRSLIPPSMRKPLAAGNFPPTPAQPTSLLDFNDDNLELIKSPPMQSKPLTASDTVKSVGPDASEVLNLQTQIAQTTTAANEARQQHTQLEASLATIALQKSELTAKYAEIKAQHDAEVQAVQELQDTLKRENEELESSRIKQLQAQKEKLRVESNEIQQEGELEQSLEQIEQTIQQLQAQRGELNEALERGKGESSGILQKIAQLTEEMQALKMENDKLSSDIEQQNIQLQTSREQLASVTAEREKLDEEVNKHNEELAHLRDDANRSFEAEARHSPVETPEPEETPTDNKKAIAEPTAFIVQDEESKSPEFNEPVRSNSERHSLSPTSFDEAFPAIDSENLEENPFTSGFDDSFIPPNASPNSHFELQPQEPVTYGNPIFWESPDNSQPVDPISTSASDKPTEEQEKPSVEQVDQEEPFVSPNYTEEPEPMPAPVAAHKPEINLNKELPVPTLEKDEAPVAVEENKETKPDVKEPQAESSAVHFSEGAKEKGKIMDDFDTIFDDEFVDLKAKRASGINGGLTEFDAAFDTDFDVDFDTSFDTSKAKSPFDEFELNSEFPSAKQPTDHSMDFKPSGSNVSQAPSNSPFTGFGFDDFKAADSNNLTDTNDLDEAFGGKVDLNKANNSIGFDDVYPEHPRDVPVPHSNDHPKSKHKSPVFSFKPFKKKSKAVPITEDDLYSSNLKELMGMGFTQEQSVDALERYDNDLNKASNFLLDQ
ncbi:hypothetical protein K493DRAFT_320527 [Basidiobolus meristosporus CBS 931.73]|uniref:EF-hand n=1 Tax=Basidiobolus meristosporus CBS 931.73 TaxID=1314790 RepID=A0A1Y1X8P7_9FUNG|nr:hypothetical protein K493DRAFT_320527 [Basidiobolus meristosporus CBS 931.73]|eukprot:ORX82089.1 hypothetical protein K493DRAFT_320527 [Basidiobolus meristosporus CBS 931.73]